MPSGNPQDGPATRSRLSKKREAVMKSSFGLWTSLLAIAILSPSLARAGHPDPSTYTNFVLSPADIAANSDVVRDQCQERAARTPNDLGLQVACNRAFTTRLKQRLRRAIGANITQSNTQKQRAFFVSQRAWEVSHVAACDAKWRAELNPSSTSFDLAVSQCIMDETFRRALWIQRNSS
jgi:uncharacterized protein YecT (DUF1311 family)